MLNLTGNSTQGHWRMRPRRRQFVDDGVADCWLNWWRRRRRRWNGDGAGEECFARSRRQRRARRLSRILFWHKFQLLAFSSNLKQIKFCAAVDYWLPIVVRVCVCVSWWRSAIYRLLAAVCLPCAYKVIFCYISFACLNAAQCGQSAYASACCEWPPRLLYTLHESKEVISSQIRHM